MMSIKDHYFVYDDNTFNCPDCHYVHFENDWRPHWSEDGKKFKIKCKNCRHLLVGLIKDGLTHITTYAIESFVYRKKNKIKMKKRIDVQKHVNRYVDVDIRDKAALVAKLQESIEYDRQTLMQDMKSQMQQLEQGQLPPDDIKRPARKPKVQSESGESGQSTEILDDISSDEL